MFERRYVLLGTGLLLFSARLTMRSATAQTNPDLSGIYSGAFLGETQDFAKLRQVAAAFISLRAGYNGPLGYEAGTEWIAGASRAWTQAFGRNGEERLVSARAIVTDLINSDAAQSIFTAADMKLISNIRVLTDFLNKIGIAEESVLYRDILRAQAAMMLLLSAETPDVRTSRSLSYFDNFTWIYPFCGGS